MLAKSKLNGTETLMSQALIEFKTIVYEKEKYDQIKILEIKEVEMN